MKIFIVFLVSVMLLFCDAQIVLSDSENGAYYNSTWQILFVVFVIFAVTLYWNRRLTKEIEQRKIIEEELIESRKHLALAIEGGHLGSWDVDLVSGITVVNEQWAKMLGYTLKEIEPVSRKFWERTIHPDDLKEVLREGKRYREGKKERYDIEYRVLTKNGETRWFESIGKSVEVDKKGKIIRIAGVVMDTTERKYFEMQLKNAQETAQRATRAKSEFLANMSHEIRTPMNAVLGFAQLLEKTTLTTQQGSYLSVIKAGGDTLLQLINDILDLSKIEAGKLDIEYAPIDIYSVMYDLEQFFHNKIEEKNLSFLMLQDENMPRGIFIDEVRLRQIFFNLISNAIKFTQKGQIIVGSKLLKISNNRADIVFFVEDTGIGIPVDRQSDIFDAFEQVNQESAIEGTGLGLAITKKLTELMNGRIFLKSKYGQGSVFSVEFSGVKLDNLNNMANEESNVEQQILFKYSKALIVDDIDNNRFLLREICMELGLETIEAINGKDAIEKIKLYVPDIVFMDIKMPIMDGYDAIEIIKNDNAIKSIPVIAITASVLSSDKANIMAARFDGYIRKPFTERQIEEELMKFIGHKHVENYMQTEGSNTIVEDYIENIPQFIIKMEEQLLSEFRVASKSREFNRIKSFAEKLYILAETYRIGTMTSYADKIKRAVDDFDVIALENLIKSFEATINKLKMQVE